jgi:hypothetical protein
MFFMAIKKEFVKRLVSLHVPKKSSYTVQKSLLYAFCDWKLGGEPVINPLPFLQ